MLKKENVKKYYNEYLKVGNIYKDLIKRYNIGILTVMIRKYYLKKKIFNDNYNIIGDFDLFLRLSKKNYFQAVQQPVATYRIHEDNLSLKSRILEVKEYKNWYKKK